MMTSSEACRADPRARPLDTGPGGASTPMPYLYHLDPTSRVVFQFAVGPIDDLRLLDEIERACLPSDIGRLDVLCDYRHGNTSRVTLEGIRRGAELLSTRPKPAPAIRWAVIATDPATLEFARQLDEWITDPSLECRGFATADEARSWLGLPPESELRVHYSQGAEFPPGVGLLPH